MQGNKNNKIGERLGIIRMALGFNQTKFAKQLGISQSAYNYYESGNREMPTSLLNVLFEKFGVSSEWVLREKGHPFFQATSDVALMLIETVETYFKNKEISIEVDKKIKIYRYLFDSYEENGSITKDDIYKTLELAL